jgi:hypothetical protein
MDALRIGNKTMVMKWEDFKALLRSKLDPIGYGEEKIMKW